MMIDSTDLDNEVNKAFVIITGHWGVGTDDQAAVHFAGQVNVLT